MSNCTCEPKKPDPDCPAPVPVDITGRRAAMRKEDPCAHCGAGIDYCRWAIFTADIGACCTPCKSGPRHEHEAAR